MICARLPSPLSAPLFAALLFALMSPPALAFDEEEEGPWQEKSIALPAAPQTANRQSFYVSSGTHNRFFVDTASLSVDADGVVRYILIIETAGGAHNVSYEGIRCKSGERRIYATGRPDGQWTPSRNPSWKKISNNPVNRQHAALYDEHFCPGGVIARNRELVLNSLRSGPRHPDRIYY